MATPRSTADLLALLKRQRVVRSSTLEQLGYHRMQLKRLVEQGIIAQLGRGLYGPVDPAPTTNASIAEVVARLPTATLCLLTALRIHELTTQNPFEVWILINRRSRRPSIDYPPIQVVGATGDALTAGTETVNLDGITARITTPAKTVVDCFKYRARIGDDVALEALRDAWRKRVVTMDALFKFAKIDRVTSVIRPYLEAIQ